MARPRLPVEFAMFPAVIGIVLFVFGVGMAGYIRFGEGFPLNQPWTWQFAAAGVGIFLATALFYYSGLVQFVRQRVNTYDPFFDNLPYEDEDLPLDFDGEADRTADLLSTRWPRLWSALLFFFFVLSQLARKRMLTDNWLMRTDLGSLHNGGVHWSVADVVTLGIGTTIVVAFLGLLIRRVWALQRAAPPDGPDSSA